MSVEPMVERRIFGRTVRMSPKAVMGPEIVIQLLRAEMERAKG